MLHNWYYTQLVTTPTGLLYTMVIIHNWSIIHNTLVIIHNWSIIHNW